MFWWIVAAVAVGLILIFLAIRVFGAIADDQWWDEMEEIERERKGDQL